MEAPKNIIKKKTSKLIRRDLKNNKILRIHENVEINESIRASIAFLLDMRNFNVPTII